MESCDRGALAAQDEHPPMPLLARASVYALWMLGDLCRVASSFAIAAAPLRRPCSAGQFAMAPKRAEKSLKAPAAKRAKASKGTGDDGDIEELAGRFNFEAAEVAQVRAAAHGWSDGWSECAACCTRPLHVHPATPTPRLHPPSGPLRPAGLVRCQPPHPALAPQPTLPPARRGGGGGGGEGLPPGACRPAAERVHLLRVVSGAWCRW